MSRLVFSPLSIWFLLGLILLVVVGLPLLFLGVIGAALSRLGFSFWVVVLLLVVIVVGSFVNVPLCTMRRGEGRVRRPRGQYAPSMYDRMYRTDRWECEDECGMAVSVNLGGAVVPVLISVYLIGLVVMGEVAGGEWFLVRVAAAVGVVSVVMFFAARPVRGIGVATPLFVGPLVTVAVSLMLCGGFGLPAAMMGFVAGTLGTLIGADLLHLREVYEGGCGMLSIGGAGTFDGIFLTAIVAALLASF
ncbi:DUF1614 domain-containing protein [Methanocorpusculum sp. CW153]|uniref:DUF1614 domain-containing protein n=1 Tax=Methanocorpusculum vombati TaxID=3002864 RepID=A0ABT4IPR3_9EURY|nr:DUF1614 domain-containing protein [Methanocorpusculum vombati]